MRRWLALCAVLFVVACGAAPETPPVPAAEPAPSAVPSVSVASVSRPVRVAVPDRGIDGPVMAEGLGLTPEGGHAEPPVEEPMLASWYNLGPVPGERGPAVVLGHVNGGGQPGIFANLNTVVEGDRVSVFREDSSEVVFEVYRTLVSDKASFPAGDVYGAVDLPELRLITCGGVFDPAANSYVSNVIIFARIV